MTVTQVHRSIHSGVRRGSASALVVFAGLLCPAAAAAGAVAPLPASDYAVRAACGPPAPDSAGCLALQLVPETVAALAHAHPLGMTRSAPPSALSPKEGDYGLRPQDFRSAYFPDEQPDAPASPAQTIALVDAYDDPHAEADLATYDKEFGLPACTEANGCFRKVNQQGAKTPLPSSSGAEAKGWAIEISTDVESARGVCQNCHIVLVEATSPSFEDLEEGEATAGRPVADGGLGATEISDSWGGSEQGASAAEDDLSAFNQPGVVIAAAAGDDGYLDWDAEKAAERGYPDYPASSPHVVAVGGTHLTLSAVGDTWESESVWDGDGATGGGCSTVFAAPAWQQRVVSWPAVGCDTGAASKRAVADVSADGDPYTGAAIYDSTGECEYEEGGKILEGSWCTIGGTSLASPIVAAMFALAGGAHGVEYPAQTLYENEVESLGSRHDVESGSNGKCSKAFESDGLSGCTSAEEAASSNCSTELICLAGIGYDGPSGVGSPDGIGAFQPGGGEEGKKQVEEKKQAEEKKAEEKKQAEEEEQKKEKEEEEKRNVDSGGGSGSGAGGSGSGSGSSGGTGSATSGTSGGTSGTASGGTSGTSGTGDGASGTSGTGGASGTSGTPTSSAANELIPELSALSLTHAAVTALSHPRPQVLQLAFMFTLSARARVRVALAKEVRLHGRTYWQTLPDTLTIAAAKGHDDGRLNAHGALARGRYRLTLTPAGGVARTLTFQIG